MSSLRLLVVVVEAALICAITAELSSEVVSSQPRRPKRMMWSSPLLDSDAPFLSPKYYAYITIGSTWSRFRLNLYRRFNLKFLGEGVAHPDSHWCGGSMLTPRAVGTACHCISTSQRINGSYSRKIPRNGWEDFYAVFNGYYTAQDMEDNPIEGSWGWSKKFVIHQKCAIIHLYKNWESGILTHDFGLILLTKALTFPKPATGFVATYTVSDIAKMFNFMNRKEPICLAIGYGAYYFEKRGVIGPHSPVMMHGWMAVRNYVKCIKLWDQLNFVLRLKQLGYSYYSIISSICATFFGKFRNQIMKGDSGGPLTCDNIYVGLFQQGSKLDSFKITDVDLEHGQVTTSYVSHQAAIAFALEWHSAEYRRNLDENLETLAVSSAKDDLLPERSENHKPNFKLLFQATSILSDGSKTFSLSTITSTIIGLIFSTIL